MLYQKPEYAAQFKKVLESRLPYSKQVLSQRFLEYKGHKVFFEYFIHAKQKSATQPLRLIFGLHGGGGCPAKVNDQQFNNHKHLYDNHIPDGSIWCVLRSPENVWDMWWKEYIPEVLIILTQCFAINRMADYDRVFITGYSAGGDGLYHLGGMMADHLAGAAMMAGHPNKAEIYNIRNIAFSIQVGDNDHAYDRSNWAKVYIEKLNLYQHEYGGFEHYSKVHQGSQHWMNKNDTAIFKYIFEYKRNPYPNYILFKQHPRTFKKTFYYLKVETKHTGVICCEYHDNKFRIQTEDLNTPIIVRLNSCFIDFNKEVEVYLNNELSVRTFPKVDKNVVLESIEEFMDPALIFEEELMCIPQHNVKAPSPHPFRPRELEGTSVSVEEKIRQKEKEVQQDGKKNVRFEKGTDNVHKKEQEQHLLYNMKWVQEKGGCGCNQTKNYEQQSQNFPQIINNENKEHRWEEAKKEPKQQQQNNQGYGYDYQQQQNQQTIYNQQQQSQGSFRKAVTNKIKQEIDKNDCEIF